MLRLIPTAGKANHLSEKAQIKAIVRKSQFIKEKNLLFFTVMAVAGVRT
jgi:hypothetical protein